MYSSNPKLFFYQIRSGKCHVLHRLCLVESTVSEQAIEFSIFDPRGKCFVLSSYTQLLKYLSYYKIIPMLRSELGCFPLCMGSSVQPKFRICKILQK